MSRMEYLLNVQRATSAFPREGACPLCGGCAHASDGTLEAQFSLFSCGHCRAFVIEKRLVDVIMNARKWNLGAVLQHVASLSLAARSAAAKGAVLAITSTNWIRLAIEEQRNGVPFAESRRNVRPAGRVVRAMRSVDGLEPQAALKHQEL